MPLFVIKGPLNSGRTGVIRKRVIATAAADPLVVAPTQAAREALGRELCEEANGAMVGPAVTSPDGLAREVLARAGQPQPELASQAQKLALAGQAIAGARLRVLARSAQSRGFRAALVQLFEEMQGDRVSPGGTERPGGGPGGGPAAGTGVGGGGPAEGDYLTELLDLYRRYLELLEANGICDRAGLLNQAQDALAADPASWAKRPVFLYNFDDLSPAQLGLIRQLAETAPVTISITHEDRRSLAARARLFNELAPLLDEPPHLTEPSADYTDSPLLYHLERHFAEDDPPRHAADPSLRLLRSAGQRGEAELIAAQVKQLIVAGVRPSKVAIAVRDPAGVGRELARRLAEAGVPVALEAQIRLAETATGAALLDLLEISRGGGDAGTVIRFLRRAGTRAEAGPVDRLERRLRIEGTSEAREALAATRIPAARQAARLMELAEAGRNREFATAFEDAVREIAERTADAAVERLGSEAAAVEAAAARVTLAALRDLRRLRGAVTTPQDLAATLAELRVAARRGPIGERVRIASPYALYTVRSRRVDHLFVAGLQDREFPRVRSEGPFLSNEQRAALGMRERADNDAEEMYLFQVCLALPTRGLWLSTRIATEDGRHAQPSPFLAFIEELLEPDARGEIWPRKCLIQRDIAAVTHSPEQAPSRRELIRALALDRGATAAQPSGLDEALAHAERTAKLAFSPRPLRSPAVLGELRAKKEFGASELEAFLRDPGAWFIQRGLAPRDFGPDPEPLKLGNLSHAVLEALYRERPGRLSKPYPETVGSWQARMAELVKEMAPGFGFKPGQRPNDRIVVMQVERYLHRFLETQAECAEARVEPRYFEAGFGSREGSDKPALDLGGWSLTGKIDRIDMTPDGGAALIHDYKFSTNATKAGDFTKEGRLQLPLYAHAVEMLWGVEPYGALYHPLRAPGERPRGMVRKDEDAAADLEGLQLVRGDRLDREDFDQLIEEAVRRAGQAVEGIWQGRIDLPALPATRSPEPAAAAIHRRFRDRFAEAEAAGGEAEAASIRGEAGDLE